MFFDQFPDLIEGESWLPMAKGRSPPVHVGAEQPQSANAIGSSFGDNAVVHAINEVVRVLRKNLVASITRDLWMMLEMFRV